MTTDASAATTPTPGGETRTLRVPAWLGAFTFWLTVAGAALIAIGAQWQIIRIYGSDVPMMDQWDAEARETLGPWFRDELSAIELWWKPHNEHRIGWTRLWALLTTGLNGQWDPAFTATLNVLLRAGLLIALLAFLRPLLVGAGWWTAPPIAAAVLAAPIAWENTLHPFQSQFCFLTLSAVFQLAWLPTRPVRNWRWWAGAAAAVAGLPTMGSSLLAPCIVVAARAGLAWRGRRWTRDDSATVVLGLVLVVAGVTAQIGLQRDGTLVADGPGQFLASLVRMAAYPWHGFWPLVLVLQAPLAWWLWTRTRDRGSDWNPTEVTLVVLVAWVTLQSAALAYARGGASHGIASRYADIHALFLLMNAVALGAMWHAHGERNARARTLLAWTWFALAGVGLSREARLHTITYLWPMPERWAEFAEPLRDYVRTGDAAHLRATPDRQLAHPSPDTLMSALDDPNLRRVLPASIRAPAAFRPKTATGFVLDSGSHAPVPPAAYPAWYAKGDGPSLWRSEPLPTSSLLPVLRVTFAGDPRLAPRALRLETDAGSEVLLEVRSFAGDKWQTAHLFVPRGARSVRLVAEAGPDGAWLAFQEPVELGFGSWLAHQARKLGVDLIWCGAVLLAVGLAFGEPHPPAARARD
jgi:hypothetical protein